MQRIAIYGRLVKEEHLDEMQRLFSYVIEHNKEVILYNPFYNFLKNKIELPPRCSTFYDHEDIVGQADLLFSIGGDGTILDSATLVRDSGIPIVGINSGRLGFLSTIRIEEIEKALNMIFNDEYYLDKRRMIQLETEQNLFGKTNFALNELVIHKKDTSSMIAIHSMIDGEELNTYWADGLIISTPTGSTAYSLSCGGPMIFPGSNNLIITPVAPHNLNSRPLVIPDDKEIRLRVEGRSRFFMVSLDSRMETIDSSTELTLRKCPFEISLLRLKGQSFIDTISKKLHWGLDERN
jgi:NAD+ kinase